MLFRSWTRASRVFSTGARLPVVSNTRAHLVDTSYHLHDDQLIDLLLVQWHTPQIDATNPPQKISDEISTRREQFLRNLSTWLAAQDAESSRPWLIVAPEISLPASLIAEVDKLVRGSPRPIAFVAGLELLTWAEYGSLLEVLPEMPEQSSWLRGGNEEHVVNTAMIWLRGADGTMKKYLQPKRNPSHPEQPDAFRCSEILLFRSLHRGDRKRFNFSVQICSDFTSPDSVEAFRAACESSCPGISLDLTIVPQYDPNQYKDHWGQAISKYFSPSSAIDMVSTRQSALLLVNNASPAPGKSVNWGESRLAFFFQIPWQAEPAPTYAISPEGASSHQASIMRESGPTLYLLRYRPPRLVDAKPGSGQATPLSAAPALCSPIFQEGFVAPTRVIHPVLHWFLAECSASKASFEEQLENMGLDEEQEQTAAEAMNQAVAAWETGLNGNEIAAKKTVETYFTCQLLREIDGYPWNPREPRRWCPEAQGAAVRLIHVTAALLRMADANSLQAPRIEPSNVLHARMGSDLGFTFLWGGQLEAANSLLQAYVALMNNKGNTESLLPVLAVVVDGTTDAIASSEATELLSKTLAAETKKAPEVIDAEAHLQKDGSVTNPLAERRSVVLMAGQIFAALHAAGSAKDASEALVAALSESAP